MNVIPDAQSCQDEAQQDQLISWCDQSAELRETLTSEPFDFHLDILKMQNIIKAPKIIVYSIPPKIPPLKVSLCNPQLFE